MSAGSRASGQPAAARTALTVAPGASSGTVRNLRLSARAVCCARSAGLTNILQVSGRWLSSQIAILSACLMPLAVSRRPRSGSPGSASACRHRSKSIDIVRWSSLLALALSQLFEQLLLGRPRLCPAPWLGALIAAVLAELPRVMSVGKIGFQSFGDNACLEIRIEYRERHFDTAEKIAPHPVGAGQIDVLLAVVLEVPNTVVLEKSTDDGAHADAVRD